MVFSVEPQGPKLACAFAGGKPEHSPRLAGAILVGAAAHVAIHCVCLLLRQSVATLFWWLHFVGHHDDDEIQAEPSSKYEGHL